MRLAGRIALGDLDAFHAVVADHAAPDGIVEIEHQATAALAAHRADDARDVVGVKRHKGVRERKFCQVPQGR